MKDGMPNSAAGIIWVRCFTAREAWGKRRVLYRLDPDSAFAREARCEFIGQCADRKRIRFLRPLLRLHRDHIRSDTTAWGQVGYALVQGGQYRRAAAWLSDWRERRDIEPWVLTNVLVALQRTKRDAEALEVSRFALGLRSDHTTAQHQLWLALHDANRGVTTSARTTLDEQHYDSLPDFSKTQWTLVNAICSVAEAPPAGRRTACRDHCRELLKPEHALIRTSAGLSRGAKAGMPFPRLRAWWFFVSGGIPAAQGTSGVFRLVLVVLIGLLVVIALLSADHPREPSPVRPSQFPAAPTAVDLKRLRELQRECRTEEQLRRIVEPPRQP